MVARVVRWVDIDWKEGGKKENTVPRQQNMYLWWELAKGGGNKHVQIQMLRKR